MSGDEVTAVPHTSSWPEPHVPWEFHCHGIGEFDFSALIGKEAGDTAEVRAPGGLKRYDVVEVRYT